MSRKTHDWKPDHDTALEQAVKDCAPIFEHYSGEQNKKYSQSNAWDAVAGRLLPDVCVTGAACWRRWQILSERKEKTHEWRKAEEMVDKYERDLAETTFDGVAELLGNMDAMHDRLKSLETKLAKLVRMWE